MLLLVKNSRYCQLPQMRTPKNPPPLEFHLSQTDRARWRQLRNPRRHRRTMTTHPSNHHNNQKLKFFLFFFFQSFLRTPLPMIWAYWSSIATSVHCIEKEERKTASATAATVWEPCERLSVCCALFSYNPPLFFCDIVIAIVSRGEGKKGWKEWERERDVDACVCGAGMEFTECYVKEGYTPLPLSLSSSLLSPEKKGLEEVKMGFFPVVAGGKGEEWRRGRTWCMYIKNQVVNNVLLRGTGWVCFPFI